MIYGKVDFIKSFLSPRFLAAPPWAQGVYSVLLGKCSLYENGGVIKDCRGFTSDQWCMAYSVKMKDLLKGSSIWSTEENSLWWWDGNDLRIFWYPDESQEKIDAYNADKADKSDGRKETSKENGAKGGRPPKQQNNLTHNLTDNLTHNLTDNLTENLTHNLNENLNNLTENLKTYPLKENKIKGKEIKEEEVVVVVNELGFSETTTTTENLGFESSQMRYDPIVIETYHEATKRWNEIPHVTPIDDIYPTETNMINLASRMSTFGDRGKEKVLEAVEKVATSDYFKTIHQSPPMSFDKFLREKWFRDIANGDLQQVYNRGDPAHRQPQPKREGTAALYMPRPVNCTDEPEPTEEELRKLIEESEVPI